MLNIFNLFLFLLVLWLALMLVSGNLTFSYLLFGIVSSAFIAAISYHVKIIDKKSELLYLSIGFYRYFIKLYFKSFFHAIGLIIDLAIGNKANRPIIYEIEVDNLRYFNLGLVNATINMNAGLFCIANEENKFKIHAMDEKYFNSLDLFLMNKQLPKINDDNLV